jgi:hypothetical protein
MFVGFIEFFNHFFSENFLAFLASKHEFCGSLKFMILGKLVTFDAVEPFFAARSSDGYLSVHNMFAHVD